MDSTLLIAAPCHIRLLIDFWESRVEILRESIVESTGLSVMLTCNHDQRVDFAAPHIALLLVFCLMDTDPRGVAHGLLMCHLGLPLNARR